MNISHALQGRFYDENWDDAPGYADEAAERNQRIADATARIMAGYLRGESWDDIQEDVFLAAKAAYLAPAMTDALRWRMLQSAILTAMARQAKALAEDSDD